MIRQASDTDWSMPVVVGSDVRESLARDLDFADAFFLAEARRLRRIYVRTGSPRLTYICGAGIVDLGKQLTIKGSIGLAVVGMTLAEMLIASGATGDDLAQAEGYLIAARNQLEGSRHAMFLARVLVQWYLLMSVCFKARGQLDGYEQTLAEGVSEPRIGSHTETGDPPRWWQGANRRTSARG